MGNASYLVSDKTSTPRELLVSAKQDKLVLSHYELRELVLYRLSHVYSDRNAVIVLYKSMLEILHSRILRGEPVIIDNFGVISKKTAKSVKFNIFTRELAEIEYYLTKLVLHKNFKLFFINKLNRKLLLQKIIKRSKEFVKIYGKIKVIGN